MHGKRVLIVEDQWMLGDDLATILRNAQMAVTGPIGTVSDALAALETTEFDAALLDIDLHGVQSFEVAAVLSAKEIPFAFVSGYGHKLVPDGFNGVPFLCKPITSGKVLSLTRELCLRSR